MEDLKLYSLKAASLMLAISKQSLYKIVSDGEIQIVRIGKRSKIPGFELKRFLSDKLQRENIVEPETDLGPNIHLLETSINPLPVINNSKFYNLLNGA